jgi:hypothetical protein
MGGEVMFERVRSKICGVPPFDEFVRRPTFKRLKRLVDSDPWLREMMIFVGGALHDPSRLVRIRTSIICRRMPATPTACLMSNV